MDNMYFSRQALVENLEQELMKTCRSYGMLGNNLYEIEELNEKWSQSAPQYMADVVPEIPHYPMVAIAWAAYYGLAAAYYWDLDWDKVKDCPDLYAFVRDLSGFDSMDDYVTWTLLSLDPKSKSEKVRTQSEKLTSCLQACSEKALNMIRHQGIEPQSKEAFYLFAAVEKLMFRIGVSIQLYRSGYRYEKLGLN